MANKQQFVNECPVFGGGCSIYFTQEDLASCAKEVENSSIKGSGCSYNLGCVTQEQVDDGVDLHCAKCELGGCNMSARDWLNWNGRCAYSE